MFQLRPLQIPSFQLNSLLNTVTISDRNKKKCLFWAIYAHSMAGFRDLSSSKDILNLKFVICTLKIMRYDCGMMKNYVLVHIWRLFLPFSMQISWKICQIWPLTPWAQGDPAIFWSFWGHNRIQHIKKRQWKYIGIL